MNGHKRGGLAKRNPLSLAGKAVLAAGVLAAFLVSGRARSQGLPEAGFGEPWNSVGVGVRAIGMGSAFTAVSDDLSGLYWNPAGIVRMKDNQLGLMTGPAYTMRKPDPSFSDVIHGRGIQGELWRDIWSSTIFKYFGSIGFVTTAFKPWGAGLLAYRSYHPESPRPWQEEVWQGTFVMPINSAHTAGLGINVKYMMSDQHYEKPYYNQEAPFTLSRKVAGWAMDSGLMYVIPLPARDRYREMNIGLMAVNLVGVKRFQNTDTEMPREAKLGAAFMFDDLLPRERSILSVEMDQAIVSNIGMKSTQLRAGFEQWFFRDLAAVRAGYAMAYPQLLNGKEDIDGYRDYSNPPLQVIPETEWSFPYLYIPTQQLTGGFSVNVWNIQADFAATMPLGNYDYDSLAKYYHDTYGLQLLSDGDISENNYAEIPETAFRNDKWGKNIWPVESVQYYFQLIYKWKSPAAAPFAKVSVEPLVFSPKKAEVASFFIDYRDELGIESWDLTVRNSSRAVVRVFSGKGAPPGRLVWDGLNDKYDVAVDDDHTYTLRIRNNGGVETVTAPKALRVFTPDQPAPGDPSLIFRLLQWQEKNEVESKGRLSGAVSKRLGTVTVTGRGRDTGRMGEAGREGEMGEGGVLPGGGLPPTVAPSATAGEQPIPPPGGINFRGLAPEQILRVQVPPAGGGGGQEVVLEYNTQRYILKYLVREMRSLTEQMFAAVGPGGGPFVVQARYGNHLMVVNTSMEVVRALRAGRIDEKQWAKGAFFTLDGVSVRPALEGGD